MSTSHFIAYFVSVAALACGGAATPAKTSEPAGPASEGSETPAKDDLAPAKLTNGGGEPSGSDTSEPAAAASLPGKTPRQIVLQEEASFLFDFRRSDIGTQAEEQCAKRSGDDPAANAKCMARAVEAQEREGLSFSEDDDGTLWLTRFVVQKGKQRVRSRVKCEIGEQQGSSFKVTTQGASTDPKELSFELPDEYTLIHQDPKKGKVVYELRLGLIGEGG